MPGARCTRWCPGSDIRIVSQQASLRMSEPKGHQKFINSNVALDLTFAWRTRGDIDANVKSATLASRGKNKNHTS
jgi:hypothetical protein